VGFLLFTPLVLVYPGDFITGVLSEVVHTARGHEGQPVKPWGYFWTFHLRRSLIPGIMMPLFLAGVGGIVYGLKKRRDFSLVLVAAVVLFYLSIEGSSLKPPPNFDRYALPVAMLWCVFAALAVERLFKLRRWGLVAGGITLLVVIVFPLRKDYLLAGDLGTDTRLLAEQWVH